jgi:hypothetical protein
MATEGILDCRVSGRAIGGPEFTTEIATTMILMDVLPGVLDMRFRHAGLDDFGFDDAHPGLIVDFGFYEGDKTLEILFADKGK